MRDQKFELPVCEYYMQAQGTCNISSIILIHAIPKCNVDLCIDASDLNLKFQQYIVIHIQKYIVEIHTSNIIIVKNHNADVNSTGFIYQSSGALLTSQ